jgi:hypothetical protein
VRLGHRGQLKGWQGGKSTNIIRRDLIRRDPNVDLMPVFASGNIAVNQVDNSSACGAPLKGAMGTPEIPFIIRH